VPLVRLRRAAALPALAFAAALVCGNASALVWPDVPERVEHGLASADPNERRLAATELGSLGPARGAPLVMRALADTDT
jgi:hypothetical protein